MTALYGASTAQTVRRSWLLIPATRRDLIEASWTYEADVIVLDLEDLVHEDRKAEARGNIREAIDIARKGGAEIFVRSDLELMYADFEASIWRGLQGVVLPKVESVNQVCEADELLSRFEAERGVRQAGIVGEINEYDYPRTIENSLELHLSLETALGNHLALDLVAASARVRSVSLGRADLTMNLRGGSTDLPFLPFLMQRLVTLAHVAGVTPVGAWWQGNSRGLEASEDDTLRSAQLGAAAGFRGAICVQPEQVRAINDGFTPGPEQVRQAEDIVEAFERALQRGSETAEAQGVRVNRARFETALALLEWSRLCEERDASKERARAVSGVS